MIQSRGAGARKNGLMLLFGLAALAVAHQSMAQPQRPYVIAPMIEWFGYCATGAAENSFEAVMRVCNSRKNYGVTELRSALDAMEPGGAQGRVQVGYTVVLNLLTLQQEGVQATFDRLSATLAGIDRPVVLYLFGNHFASTTSRKPLAEDSQARFSDQSTLDDKYFGGGIAPVTLDMSPQLEVNRIRREAMTMVGKWFQALPESSKNRVIGVTLAGELHHFYDDFSGGVTRYEQIRVTDYSPASTAAFQTWLRDRYSSIHALNKVLGTQHSSFDTVMPPSKDIRRHKATPISEHFDSYAHGVVSIDGWLANLPAGQSIRVYLNGLAIGTAEYGLSRQDVYEVEDSIKRAQVGFRYQLDFSSLPRGSHHLQIVLDGPQAYLLAERHVLVITGAKRPGATTPPRSAKLPAPPKDLRFYVDRPNNQLTLYYNPLARDWLAFREQQVTNAYDSWYELAIQNGLPRDKLFSHQIGVKLFGGWNPVLFASDASIQGVQRYKKGINLYGGAASMALLRRHYLSDGEPFAVPELHTQAWKDASVPKRVLKELQQGGAAFVTPYFMSMAPDRYRNPADTHNKFRISPDNPAYGSDHFYRAIVDIAKD
ncbi:MAG: hypothetical protein HEQ39_07725 [Rhizobacter sp.]